MSCLRLRYVSTINKNGSVILISGRVDVDFWKAPARRICAVMQSDLDAMKVYLDAMRETPVSRKRRASTSASELQARSSTSSPATKVWHKLDGDIHDIQTQLDAIESNVERLHDRLENVDDKLDESISLAQSRFDSRRSRSTKLATMTMKLLGCRICHLFPRTPVSITTCCRQWLGCEACFTKLSASRCPLCNAGWTAEKSCVTVRGLEGLRPMAQELRKHLGSNVVHDENSSSSESDLPPFARPPSSARSATATAAAGADDDNGGPSAASPVLLD